MLATVRTTGQVLLSGLLLLILTGSVARAQDPLPAPDLVAPPNQALIFVEPTDTVPIDWTDVTGASSYEAQVFTSSDTSLEPMALKSRVLNVSDFLIPAQALLDSIPAGETSKTFYWRARARNADGEGDWSDTASGLWEFTIVANQAPSIDSIDDASTDELAPYELIVTATDGNTPANDLTFSLDAESIARGMMIERIDSTSARITWTPNETDGPGDYNVTVTVQDDSDAMFEDSTSYTLTVGEVNSPPRFDPIPLQRAEANFPFSVTPVAHDDDIPANGLIFSLDAASEALGMTIDPATGEVSWTPAEENDPGSYPVTITATDDGAPPLQGSVTFTIQVGEDPLAPKLDPIGDQAGDELTPISIPISAMDGDTPPDSLTFTIDPASAALGISVAQSDSFNATINWTPGEEHGPGTYSITVTVTDDSPEMRSATETFTLTIGEVNVAPELDAIPDQVAASNNTLNFTAAASDSDIPENTLTFSLDATAEALGMSIDPDSGLFAWTPDESHDPGNYPVTVTVTDEGGLSDSQTLTITVPEDPLGPTIDPISDTTIAENDTTFALTVTATDGDIPPDSLQFSLVDAPAGMTVEGVDANSAVIAWAPTEADGPGSFEITVVVDDGTGLSTPDTTSFILTVDEVNEAPVLAAIGNQEANAGATLSFTVTATDPDVPANVLTFSLDAAAEALGMSIDPATGAFTWTPDESMDPGDYVATITVTDNGDPSMSDDETFTISVPEDAQAPVLTAIADTTVNEMAPFELVVRATDADVPPDGLTFSLDEASTPAGMTIGFINGTSALISWTPTEEQGPASYDVTVIVQDDSDAMLSDSGMFTITVGEVNRAPELESPGLQEVDANVELTFTATATDPDVPANGLVYSLAAGTTEPGMAIDPATGVFTWTPDESNDPDIFLVGVVVTDDGTPALSDTVTVPIVVGEDPRRPKLAEIDDQVIDEESTLSLVVTATDGDMPPDDLEFSVTGAAELGITVTPINTTSAQITWTPTEEQGPKTYSLEVMVVDDSDLMLLDAQLVQVTVNEVNTAPVLAPIEDQTAPVGIALELTAMATDVDLVPGGTPANTLTFYLDSDSESRGMMLDPASGAFSWIPDETFDPGVYPVTITVGDDGIPPLSDAKTFSITVPETAHPPVLAALADTTIQELTNFELVVSATDADVPADDLTFFIDPGADLAGMSISRIDSTSALLAWTPTEEQGGQDYPVTVSVQDDSGLTLPVSATMTITVIEANSPPFLGPIEDAEIVVLQTYMDQTQFGDADIPPDSLNFWLDDDSIERGFTAEADGSTITIVWTAGASDVGAHLVTLSLFDGQTTVSESFTVTVSGGNPPQSFTVSGVCTASLELPLRWFSYPLADQYLLEIADNLQFTSPDTFMLADTVYTVPTEEYSEGEVYYWRIRGQHAESHKTTAPTDPRAFRRWPATHPVAATLNFGLNQVSSSDFRMISVPGNPPGMTVESTFAGQEYDVDWFVFRDNGTNVPYPEYLDKWKPGENDALFNFQPGSGFWAASKTQWQVSGTVPSAPLDAETERFYGIPLIQGSSAQDNRWTMISNPFDFPVPWSAVVAENQLVDPSFNEALWGWDGSQYVQATVLEPYTGYYINNPTDLPELRMPCLIPDASSSVAKASPLASEVRLQLREEGSEVISNVVVGEHEASKAGLDEMDQFAPPPLLESYRLSILGSGLDTEYQRLHREARAPSVEGHVYDLEVLDRDGKALSLGVKGNGLMDAEAVMLVDVKFGRQYDLKAETDVRLEPEAGTRLLKLLVGSADFVAAEAADLMPEAFTLLPNYPNPFQSETHIRYTMPEPGPVTLTVFDVLGREVRTLVSQDVSAGFHEVVWDGRSSSGAPVASGVFFYVLRSGERVESGRMVRVR